MTTRTVLIVGGGMAGLAVATALRKKDKIVEILLIEPKEYFQVYWACYRSLFDSKVANDSIVHIQPWATKHDVKYIQAAVTKLNDTSATLSNGQTIDNFNVAIICAGAVCQWPSLGRTPAISTIAASGNKKGTKATTKGGPTPKCKLTREQRLEQLQKDGQKLLNSGSVLIVGGGLIGVETAGDLAYYAKQQGKELEITLVHSGETLVPEFTNRASKMTYRKLTKLGVKIILDDKVVHLKRSDKSDKKKSNQNGIKNTSQPTTTFRLEKSNQEISANHVIWTNGISSQNKQFINKQYLNKNGWIQVDDYFRIKKCPNGKLFAFGDCCDLLPNAGIQVLGAMDIIANNVKAVLDTTECLSESATNGENNSNNRKKAAHPLERRMKKALVQSEVYVATIGKKKGVALTPLGAIGFGLPRIKNKTMFLMKPRKDLGLNKMSAVETTESDALI